MHIALQSPKEYIRYTVESLIFARTLLRKFREAPWIQQNKTRGI